MRYRAGDTTSGLVAYLDGEPVGWCAVEPRTAYVWLGRVPWAGRAEDKADDGVWAVTCSITRAGFRLTAPHRKGGGRPTGSTDPDAIARLRGRHRVEYPSLRPVRAPVREGAL